MNLHWKKLINLHESNLFGLDIGSSFVRMVQLEKKDTGYAVTAANITKIPESGIDISHREAEIVKAIRKCVHATKVRTRHAVCSVSGPEVAVRPFSLPPLQDEEVDSAVMFEAAQVCPFNIDNAVVEYHLIPNGDEGVRGILVAATHDVIRRKARLAGKTSLECVMMDVDSLALLNCFNGQRKQKPHDAAKAVLDVGASGTTLAIVGDGRMPFVRNMHYAGDYIISQISGERNVPVEIVREALSDSESSTLSAAELRSSLESACQKLIADVTDTLRYHTTWEKASFVEQIYVCGGFAMVDGFVDMLQKRLGIEAVLWNPFDTMHCDVGQNCLDVIQNKGPTMAVAAGLAMRSI